MSIERARRHLERWGLDGQVWELAESSATVGEAAAALGTLPERIAKTLSFVVDGRVLLIVTAGDAKIDNRAFKGSFGVKPRMVPAGDVESVVGHAVGGVCPFGVEPGVTVHLDESLRRFHTVFPACGSSNSAIELTIPQLEETSQCKGWVRVTVTDRSGG